MTRLMFALACLLFASTVHAQTTATATWVQLNAIEDARLFPYSLQDGASLAVPLTKVTCSVMSGVAVCQAAVRMPDNGPHAYHLLANDPKAAAPVLLGVQPGAPNGFKVTITPVYASGGA